MAQTKTRKIPVSFFCRAPVSIPVQMRPLRPERPLVLAKLSLWQQRFIGFQFQPNQCRPTQAGFLCHCPASPAAGVLTRSSARYQRKSTGVFITWQDSKTGLPPQDRK
jgi:hypothetical protein